MADISTVLIPQDPYFVPSDAAIETAKLMFECFHAGAEVSYRTSEKPKFTDAGSGFEKLTCPACGEIWVARFQPHLFHQLPSFIVPDLEIFFYEGFG